MLHQLKLALNLCQDDLWNVGNIRFQLTRNSFKTGERHCEASLDQRLAQC